LSNFGSECLEAAGSEIYDPVLGSVSDQTHLVAHLEEAARQLRVRRDEQEALLWTKTITRVHVLTGRGVIATHMTCLTSRSISLQLYNEDS
jgi:hypothetical protein